MKNQTKPDELSNALIDSHTAKKRQARKNAARKTLSRHGLSAQPELAASAQLALLKRAQDEVKSSAVFRSVFLISGLVVAIAAYFLYQAGQLALLPLPALLAIALMQIFLNYRTGKVYRHYVQQQKPS